MVSEGGWETHLAPMLENRGPANAAGEELALEHRKRGQPRQLSALPWRIYI